MTDSVTGGLLKRGAPRTTLLNLPVEMMLSIFEHCDLVSLTHLSASCRSMRDQVHDIFTSRIEAQAKKYPEVRQSLDRLGWMKKHDSWDCKCFKMMAGPFFTWTELEEQRSFVVSCNFDYYFSPSRPSTTVAGKTFFATKSREVVYAEMAPRCGPGSGLGHNSLQTLASFNHEVVGVVIASYDNVLAVILKKRILPGDFSVSVCIFNAITLAKVCEMNLLDNADYVIVLGVAITRDTMVVHLHCSDIQMGYGYKIQIWKMNTEEPEEDGISLLHTMTPRNAPFAQHRHFWLFCQFFNINDRFLVIVDGVVKVFGRHGETPLVRQLEFENKTLKAMAIQGGSGDHLALALLSVNANNVVELTVKVYSASQGNLIVQKVGLFPRRSAPLFMKWFGDHLTVGFQQVNTVSLLSWQPGMEFFLTSPREVPVLRRSPRGNGGDTALWTANCLHVDFQGITTAVCSLQVGGGSKKVLFRTWKSTS